MTLYRLVLAPVDPEALPADTDSLITSLGRLGLTGLPFPVAGRTHYLPGERFLELISFLGCSPVVALAPPADPSADPAAHAEAFCHIGLWYAGEKPLFVGGRNTVSPRCPNCRQREESWQALVEAWTASPTAYRWRCPACSRHFQPFELDWRQSAGFGRFFVEVWGIHPAEAVPGEALLNTLMRATGTPWGYFYWQGD